MKITKTRITAALLTLTFLTISLPAIADQQKNYTTRPPFTAETLWEESLGLLNEHLGYATVDQFEKAFGVRLQPISFHDPNMTPYQLRMGTDWYIGGRLTMFSDEFVDSIQTDANGIHSEWGLFWEADTFGDSKKGQCLTVGRVQADLLNSGWSSPWQTAAQAASSALPSCPLGAICFTRILSPVPSPSHNFGRAIDLHTDRWGHLPFGQFFSTGETLNSCVTGLYIRARP